MKEPLARFSLNNCLLQVLPTKSEAEPLSLKLGENKSSKLAQNEHTMQSLCHRAGTGNGNKIKR